MNNDQFRKLVQNTPARAPSSSDAASQSSRNGATPLALGSRMRSSIPMTPRTVSGYSGSNEFARQLAERNASSSTTKKFRSTAAPKGVKLGDGYVDRAKQRLGREDEEDESEGVKRVKALEEMMKLQQIDEATFVKLREEILGDEVGERARIVKGLDFELLARVKRGEVGVEDVLEGRTSKFDAGEDDQVGEDVNDEFDELEGKAVEAITRAKEKKKGSMAPSELTGRKRNRDQILADMKAARLAAKEAAAPSLGSRFKKVGERRSETRIETDGKGREVLITVDENGNEKRKVRKVQVEEPKHELQMPDKDVAPLGMEVPNIPKVVEEEDEGDIFDDVGDDYDPLAGLDDDNSDGEGREEEDVGDSETLESQSIGIPKCGSMAPPPPKRKPAAPSQNYFGDAKPTVALEDSKPKGLQDPTLLAALKKASSIIVTSSAADETSAEEKAKVEKHRRMLQQDDRDAQDMDMSFGSSRFADEEDAEEKVKLSEWGGKDNDDEGGGEKKGEKRKRGPKKRKGDGNSAKDVLAAMERKKINS